MNDRYAEPDMQALFAMSDKIPINQTGSFVDKLAGNMQGGVVSKAFFSKENIKILQNGIRAGVFTLSKNEHVIDEQNENELIIIMRSIYLQNTINSDTNVREQISALNQLVLDYAVPQIYGELQGYIKYQEDSNSLARPLDNPQVTSTFHQLEYNPVV